jgi:hypothetical protein
VPKISTLLSCALLSAILPLPARAQSPLKPADVEKISAAFNHPSPNSLNCKIEQWKLTLDFAFRFDTGYVLLCRLGLFEGKQSRVWVYARVTPEGKSPYLFGEEYRLPEITPAMRQGLDPKKLKNEIGMSGAFGVGQGDYTVEVLAADDRNRICRKRWKLQVAPDRSQRKVPLAIQPLTVESLEHSTWDIHPPQRGTGVRLTVLLDAVPISPFESTLRAWDRAFLLESLYSLLRHTPCKSVRVVAFNLDQQREIVRYESFDHAGFIRLIQALRETETATVSVQALKKRNSPEFLAGLASQELAATEPSDAVVFLGPNARMTAKASAQMVSGKKADSPPFFYFEYYPWTGNNFPDTIQSLTKALDGKTFAVHSPAEFGQAIQKMLGQLQQD